MKTLLPMAAIVGALAWLPLAPARAACHFVPAVVACTSSDTAALAFRQFGHDAARMREPYAQDLLHRARCGTYSGAVPHDVKLMRMVKVPFPDGYETVAEVSVDDRDLVALSTAYLTGDCDPYRPTFGIGVPCEDGPGKAGCEQRKAEAIEKARAAGMRIEGEGGH